MTNSLRAKATGTVAATAALAAAISSLLWAAHASAQTYPVTQEQKTTATAVAQKGVPLGELADTAPERYTIVSGDTLWAISKLYLKNAWRWPELWGMNLEDIKNPHRIYPGQVLVLDRSNGRARLRLGSGDANAMEGLPTVRLSPKTRSTAVADNALPAMRMQNIEAFLTEPLVLSEAEYQGSARIVSSPEGRVLLARGDRAYARAGAYGALRVNAGSDNLYRIIRTAKPLKDPATGELLGYEAVYAGKANVVRNETTSTVTEPDGKIGSAIVPATLDIVSAEEEIRIGDRLIPEPARTYTSFVPHAPATQVDGRVVSVYGNAGSIAAGNQVVALNRGRRDGMEPGVVLAILKGGKVVMDKQEALQPLLKLPEERNGLLMVFRSFDRVSYALILEATDAVRAGDHFTVPR